MRDADTRAAIGGERLNDLPGATEPGPGTALRRELRWRSFFLGWLVGACPGTAQELKRRRFERTASAESRENQGRSCSGFVAWSRAVTATGHDSLVARVGQGVADHWLAICLRTGFCWCYGSGGPRSKSTRGRAGSAEPGLSHCGDLALAANGGPFAGPPSTSRSLGSVWTDVAGRFLS